MSFTKAKENSRETYNPEEILTGNGLDTQWWKLLHECASSSSSSREFFL